MKKNQSMNRWLAPSIISLVLATLFLSGCAKSPKAAIESILNQCAGQTQYVNKSQMNAAQAALYLANQMQSMDTHDCPADFRAAFQEHINAWRDASGYFASDTTLNALLEGFVSGFTGDSSILGGSTENAQIAMQNINATYNQLVTIAAAYDARVPSSVINK